jgi:predicted DCC family thiol-disulfide oxidoreductase YuxK
VFFLARRLPVRVRAVTWQATDLGTLGLTESQCRRAVQWLGADGARAAGHAAFARWLIASRGVWRLAGWPLLVPPVSWLAAGCYRLIADNRHRLPARGASCPVPGSD